jgi:hypothetical protein
MEVVLRRELVWNIVGSMLTGESIVGRMLTGEKHCWKYATRGKTLLEGC